MSQAEAFQKSVRDDGVRMHFLTLLAHVPPEIRSRRLETGKVFYRNTRDGIRSSTQEETIVIQLPFPVSRIIGNVSPNSLYAK
jgi:hypothetical protein